MIKKKIIKEVGGAFTLLTQIGKPIDYSTIFCNYSAWVKQYQ